MDLLLLQKSLVGLFAAIVVSVIVSKLRGKRLPPGPARYPILGNWLQIRNNLNHRKFIELAKEFGDVLLLRMGKRNLVVVSSLDMAKEVLHTQGVEFGSRARNLVFNLFTGSGSDLVFSSYSEHWRKMRRITMVPFFTNKVVQAYRKGWEADAAALVDDLNKNIEAQTTGIVLRKRLQLYVHNCLYAVMFHKKFDGEDDSLYGKLKELNGERSRLSQSLDYNFADFFPILRFISPFIRSYTKYAKQVRDNRFKLYKEFFIDPFKKLSSTKSTTVEGMRSAIDHILEARQKGEINDNNVLYLVENINVAAIETTMWSIEWTVAELVNHPEIQNKLRKELDTVLGDKQITEADIQRLPYLNAIMKETLRVRMPIPLLVPHMNVKDAKIGDYDVPAESKILVNAWWLANNPEHWKKPEEYRPERFLEEEAGLEVKGNDIKYIPFGTGRRQCPGLTLVIPILGIIIGHLVQNFELLPPPGMSKLDMTECYGQFIMRIQEWSTVVTKPRIKG